MIFHLENMGLDIVFVQFGQDTVENTSFNNISSTCFKQINYDWLIFCNKQIC